MSRRLGQSRREEEAISRRSIFHMQMSVFLLSAASCVTPDGWELLHSAALLFLNVPFRIMLNDGSGLNSRAAAGSRHFVMGSCPPILEGDFSRGARRKLSSCDVARRRMSRTNFRSCNSDRWEIEFPPLESGLVLVAAAAAVGSFTAISRPSFLIARELIRRAIVTS